MPKMKREPYREDRDYRAIAMALPRSKSIKDILNLIPARKVRDVREVPHPPDSVVSTHCVYLSSRRYRGTSDEYAEAIAYKERGKPVFRYDMYLARFAVPKTNAVMGIVAVPLQDMAAEVFQSIRDNASGHGVLYAAPDLVQLIKTAKRQAGDDSIVRVSALTLRVDGDPPMENIQICGRWRENILHTAAYPKLASLDIEAIPIAARVVYQEAGKRAFCVRSTRQGYLRFNVGRGAAGLPMLCELLVLLSDQGVLQCTPEFPALEEEEETAEA